MERELPLFENWGHVSIAELRAKHSMHCTVLHVIAVCEQSAEPGWGAADTQCATQRLQCPTPLGVHQQLICHADGALLLSDAFQV